MVLQKRIAKEEIQMQISLLLMQQIAQLFLILLMGYAVVKTGLLKAPGCFIPWASPLECTLYFCF
jgi:hypothetical protein